MLSTGPQLPVDQARQTQEYLLVQVLGAVVALGLCSLRLERAQLIDSRKRQLMGSGRSVWYMQPWVADRLHVEKKGAVTQPRKPSLRRQECFHAKVMGMRPHGMRAKVV